MILTWNLNQSWKQNWQRQKSLTMMSCQQIVASMANLEQSGCRTLDGWSVKLTFSLTVTFYLTKTKTELKNIWHSSHAIALSKYTIFDIKCWFFAKKNADISKIKVLVLKGIVSETIYVFVFTYQISNF